MRRAAQAVYFGVLALWVGGLATISFVVAPTAFQHAERPVAGQIVGSSLRRFGRIEIACGIAAFAASLLLRRGGRWEKLLRPGAAFLMMAIALTYVGWVYPEAAGLRLKMDSPEGQAQFALFHRLSVILVAANILIGAAQLVVSAARLKTPDGA